MFAKEYCRNRPYGKLQKMEIGIYQGNETDDFFLLHLKIICAQKFPFQEIKKRKERKKVEL